MPRNKINVNTRIYKECALTWDTIHIFKCPPCINIPGEKHFPILHIENNTIVVNVTSTLNRISKALIVA